LPGRIISPINPRVIMLGEKLILAYQRGVQRLEIATPARQTYRFNFYLLDFEQECNASKAGCSAGDLYTPKIENDWTRVQIRDDEDLKNTPFDCRQCHQRGLDQPALLMRELKSPWTHFMFAVGQTTSLPGVGGSDLMQDYLDAKGDDRYGGLAVDTISGISAFRLEVMVGNDQPLLFDAPRIENERFPWGPNGYPAQAGPSPTWNRAWEAFKRGEQLALPYVEQRAVDLDKQAELAGAYRRYRAGEIEADELPDLADIFPDDPQLRAQIGLQTEPDATPEDALIQACGGCHNDALDQNISRARFTIALSRLPRSEIDLAIARIERPRDAVGAMPPAEFRQLDDDTRDRLVDYLRRDMRAIEVDPRLEEAAKLGMVGGGGD
jgi:mono/diheme cytochrome c family protein